MYRVAYSLDGLSTADTVKWLKVEKGDNELDIHGLVLSCSEVNDDTLIYVEMPLELAEEMVLGATVMGYVDLRSFPAIVSNSDGMTFPANSVRYFEKIRKANKS